MRHLLFLTTLLMSSTASTQSDEGYAWLAGDHHIHSRYSVGWNRDVDPPTPVRGGDAIYPIHMNALMGKYFGLSWTVATDHGGPNHSKANWNGHEQKTLARTSYRCKTVKPIFIFNSAYSGGAFP